MSKQKLVGTFEVWANWVAPVGDVEENICEFFRTRFTVEAEATKFKEQVSARCLSSGQFLGVACPLKKRKKRRV